MAVQAQVGVTKIYDSAYVQLDYPNGDVPIERGVCTDVVVRAFRTVGIDLQARVHEDMKKNAEKIESTKRYYIVHNIGSGTHEEDALRWFTISGHYRW